VEVYVAFVRFHGDVCAETLAKRGFARSNFACNDDALRHFIGHMQKEAEEFHEQAMFFFSVGQAAWNVVYVKF
jgi:hypothetical protein